jgi:two-component system phosphate regulon sensor histidine kinase PhoR
MWLMVLKARLIKVNVAITSLQNPLTLSNHFMSSRKFKPVNIALALMASSLLLLVTLQSFWLRNSYEKAFSELREDANDIFRTTVLAIRDSAMMKNVRSVPSDSFPGKRQHLQFIEKVDCVKVRRGTVATGSTEMKIIVASDSPDSVKTLLQPLVTQLHGRKMPSQATFYFEMRNDTMSMDTLKTHLKNAMAKAGLAALTINVTAKTDMPITMPDKNVMLRRKMPMDSTANDGLIHSEWIPYDPFHRYQMNLSSFEPMLFKEISPQILFSFFVTLLTATAFLVMYRSLRSQQRLMEMKNDFISNITHELKTPVTTVSVALEALRSFKGLENPQTTKEYLDIAQSELNRLTLLTDKILKTAIFENKGIGFEPEPVDLLKTVDQILHSMKLIFEKQKAKVSFQRKGNSFTIVGGSVHLTNVIYNLLDNALKYSSAEPHIDITLQEDDRQVILKVADKGIGIPGEYTKKIFEKFFRVPTGDVHNVKGYGLGLSYVQAVVRSHQGWIDVISQPGEGSVFTISLPKEPARP